MPTFQSVTIGTITGKQFQVEIRPTDTVGDVKIRIEEEESIPREQQILIFREQTLKDSSPIRDLGISEGSRLQLGVHLSSGPVQSPVRSTNRKKDESVLVLLCRQRDGMYIVEVHVKDDVRQVVAPAALTQLLRDAENQDIESDKESSEDIQSETETETDLDSDYSSTFSLSTSAFVSLLATPISQTRNRKEDHSSRSARSSCRSLKSAKNTRPTTAISLLRQSAGPNITVLKSRPSTAANIQQSRTPKSSARVTKAVEEARATNELLPTNITVQKQVRFSPNFEPTSGTSPSPRSDPNLQNKSPPSKPRTSSSSVGQKLNTTSSLRKDGRLSLKSGTKTPERGLAIRKPAAFCFSCNKKLGTVAPFKCKCCHIFCSVHRYSDKHACTYNFKEEGRALLAKNNPKVGSSKVTKI